MMASEPSSITMSMMEQNLLRLRPETHDVRRHLEVETFCLQTRRTCVLSVSGHDLGRYAIPFAVMPTARTGCHKMSQRFSDLSSILFIVGQHRRIMLGLTQEEVEEMMICLIIRRKRRRRRNKRQIWIHPLQSDRLTRGHYYNLMPGLRNDSKEFF